MKAAILLAVSLSLVAVQAKAEDAVSITLPSGAAEIAASYDCGDFTLDARYINSDQIMLAELQWPDHHIIAAQVIAASGARYAAGPYVWWSTGDDATLYDITKGENDPGIACTGKS